MALVVALGAAPAHADEVPPQIGLLVMLKVLSYDSGFEARVGDRDFLVLVPYAPNQTDAARTFAAARHQRYAITLDEDLVKAGIPIGVALSNGKPQLILNVTAARAIKAEFSSAVMRVARIQQ